ncbi:hypothetical protein AB0G79_14195 [Streptomyces sp. NPDC020807]|uniref:hypothetical protein n=1 Tax=Streptomyces sp. NPDC020807 TaxID=3155119 RepID=UPI0033D4C532
MTEEHVAILRKSGLINSDITIDQLLQAAVELDKLNPIDEVAVPTLIGNWYVYHTMKAGEAAVLER